MLLVTRDRDVDALVGYTNVFSFRICEAPPQEFRDVVVVCTRRERFQLTLRLKEVPGTYKTVFILVIRGYSITLFRSALVPVLPLTTMDHQGFWQSRIACKLLSFQLQNF